MKIVKSFIGGIIISTSVMSMESSRMYVEKRDTDTTNAYYKKLYRQEEKRGYHSVEQYLQDHPKEINNSQTADKNDNQSLIKAIVIKKIYLLGDMPGAEIKIIRSNNPEYEYNKGDITFIPLQHIPIPHEIGFIPPTYYHVEVGNTIYFDKLKYNYKFVDKLIVKK